MPRAYAAQNPSFPTSLARSTRPDCGRPGTRRPGTPQDPRCGRADLGPSRIPKTSAAARITLVALAASALTIAGCAGTQPEPGERTAAPAPIDTSAYWVAPPHGSTLELTRELTISPGSARVWITASGRRDTFDVQCNLEVLTLTRDQPRSVETDQFTIVRTQRFTTTVDADPQSHNHLARQAESQPPQGAFIKTANHPHAATDEFQAMRTNISARVGIGGFGGFGGFTDYDEGASRVFEGWHWYLESPLQPDVFRLNCRGPYDDPWAALPPSIDDVRDATRGTLVLTLAADGA